MSDNTGRAIVRGWERRSRVGGWVLMLAALCVCIGVMSRGAIAQPSAGSVDTAASPVSPSNTDPAGWPTATGSRNASVLYRLDAPSTYQNSCFDPCDCITDIRSELRGTMLLTRVPVPSNTGVRKYRVTDVNWKITIGGVDVLVRGSGTYLWQPSLGPLTVLAHQLTLDLRVGDSDVMHFDSGLIPGASDGAYPPINIVIDMNDQVCIDQVFTLAAARPVPSSEIYGYGLEAPSNFQEGCLPPCLCPILIESPIAGRYQVVKMPPTVATPAVVDYAVVRVRWQEIVATTPRPPTTGSGFYSITPADVTPYRHRMLVALTTPGDPERRFDSGWQPLGPNSDPAPLSPPRRIDIAVAVNGFFCYDEVFTVYSKR